MSDLETFHPPNIAEDRSLRDRAYQVLKEAIMSLDLPPGFPLVERELAERLGISKTPIRDAINMLAAEGLVVHPLYRTAYVSIINANELIEVFEVRTELERLAISKVCQLGDSELWERARKILDESDEALRREDIATAVARGQDFHFLLIEAAQNEFLYRLLNEVDVLIVRARKLLSRLPGHTAKSNAEHRELLAAVSARDTERATTILSKHLADALVELIQALEQWNNEKNVTNIKEK